MPDRTDEALRDLVLTALWDRLEMATEVAIGAAAVSQLGEVARLCDEAAILARSGQLLLGNDP